MAAGNSMVKKDAERNAARDFINFLVRTGRLNANDIPAGVLEGGGALPQRQADGPAAPVFEVGHMRSSCIIKSSCFSI